MATKIQKTTSIVALMALAISSASASIVSISGDASTSLESTGSSFSGSIEYLYNGGNSGSLTISLTNTTSPSIGGYLTGFVFNINSADAGLISSLVSASNASFLDTGIENAAPFGMFDSGAALGANWTGGGSPSLGLGTGASGMFTFSISASDASSLHASSFLGTGNEFAVRFRGLNDGGSDKLLVPAPSGASLVAMMMLGMGARRRR